MKGFKIEVPISVKGDTSGKKFGEGIADQIKKTLGSIGIGKDKGGGVEARGFTKKGGLKLAGVLGAILGVLDSLMFIIKPVLDLFKIILMLFFLPLIPILKPALQGLSAFIKVLAPIMKKSMKGIEYLMSGQFFKDIGFIVWEGYIKPIWDGLKNAILAGWDMLKNAGIWIWNNIIVPAFSFLNDAGMWIWDMFVNGLSNVLNFGIWIWDMIVLGLQTISDLGVKLWNFIKGLFIGTIEVGVTLWNWFKGLFKGTINVATTVWKWFKSLFPNRGGSSNSGSSSSGLIEKVGNILNPFNDFIQRPGQSPTSFSPQDTIIGVKDVSSLGGKNIVVNINNTSVRNDVDIKKIANQVSQVLQRQVSGRMSQ